MSTIDPRALMAENDKLRDALTRDARAAFELGALHKATHEQLAVAVEALQEISRDVFSGHGRTAAAALKKLGIR